MHKKYRTFYFYKEYLDIVNDLPKEHQTEFLFAIIQYGQEGIYTISNPILKALFMQIKASIDASVERYKRYQEVGRRGGRPRDIRWGDVIYYYEVHNLSVSDLAKIFRCSERTIQRILKEYNSIYEEAYVYSKKKHNLRGIDEKAKNLIVYGKEDYNIWEDD